VEPKAIFSGQGFIVDGNDDVFTAKYNNIAIGVKKVPSKTKMPTVGKKGVSRVLHIIEIFKKLSDVGFVGVFTGHIHFNASMYIDGSVEKDFVKLDIGTNGYTEHATLFHENGYGIKERNNRWSSVDVAVAAAIGLIEAGHKNYTKANLPAPFKPSPSKFTSRERSYRFGREYTTAFEIQKDPPPIHYITVIGVGSISDDIVVTISQSPSGEAFFIINVSGYKTYLINGDGYYHLISKDTGFKVSITDDDPLSEENFDYIVKCVAEYSKNQLGAVAV
jgi:hypothetical protein